MIRNTEAPTRRPGLIYRLASPAYFDALVSRALPWCGALTALLFIIGVPWALAFAPRDYQQGDSFRIIYIHVPAAAFSMGIYVAMAISAAIGLVWRIKLAFVMARQCAPVGAAFTFLALATGSLWGKPMWGTWWFWDARLMSELILLFIYLGYMGLQEAFENRDSGNRASAVMAIVGVVNIPIIHYSVEWWNTLHQGSTIFKMSRPSIAPEMLWPLLIMLAAFATFALTVVLLRARNEVLEQRQTTL